MAGGLRTSPCRTRRRWLQLPLGVAAALAGLPGHAGGQLEEPLTYSVRTALSAAVAGSGAPPEPVFDSPPQQQDYLHWLAAMDARLAGHRSAPARRTDFLQTVWYEARRAALAPSLVLGLIQVESAFRKYAISPVGARGYMQVMPFWSRVIGDGDASTLFHTQTNLRFGCVILQHYLDREGGNLFMALGRYNGSRGQARYPNAVTAAQKNWLLPG